MGRRSRNEIKQPAMDEAGKNAWVPKTDIGRQVKNREITSIDEIFAQGKQILEPEIVDFLLPELQSETIVIKNTQRMTDCGRKAQFRVVVLVGDEKQHIGIGVGKNEEIRPAIASAIRDAKKHIISVPLGCGSWECGCKQGHSIPIKVVGKLSGVEVMLKPAPRGLGLAGNKIVKKVLQAAGVKDIWSYGRGHTRNIYNTAMATYNALDALNRMRHKGDWKEGEAAPAESGAAAAVEGKKAEKDEIIF